MNNYEEKTNKSLKNYYELTKEELKNYKEEFNRFHTSKCLKRFKVIILIVMILLDQLRCILPVLEGSITYKQMLGTTLYSIIYFYPLLIITIFIVIGIYQKICFKRWLKIKYNIEYK